MVSDMLCQTKVPDLVPSRNSEEVLCYLKEHPRWEELLQYFDYSEPDFMEWWVSACTVA